MSRDIDSATTEHFAQHRVAPIVLVKAEFPSGDLNLWNGVGQLEWASDTYHGAGDLMQLTPAAETQDLRANGMSFTLSGIPSDLIDLALREEFQDRPITARLGAIDDQGRIIAPYPFFRGRMDTMNMEEGGETASIELTAENRLIDLQRAKTRRYTDHDQKAQFPGDEGLAQVTSLNDGRKISWGTT